MQADRPERIAMNDPNSSPKKVWMLRYSEVSLKSPPVRRQWENAIVSAVKKILPGADLRVERGRIWAGGEIDPEKLKLIFGVVSYSICNVFDLKDLNKGILDFCEEHDISSSRTFALRVRRTGSHSFSSRDIAIELGDVIRKRYPAIAVSLDSPDFEIHVEIRNDTCYIFSEILPGAGGIPAGVEGTLVALLSGGIDSPVAAYMMMKRGCRIIPVYVSIEDYLDETSLKKAGKVVDILRLYQPDMELQIVNDSYLLHAKEVLREQRSEKFTCVICKRRMYRIASAFASENGAMGFVTGEAMGQVASQTLDNLFVLTEGAEVPVYRPLIGFDKEDIIRIAREIGTFGPSTGKACGCGAVPVKPATKTPVAKIRMLEKAVSARMEDLQLPDIFRSSGKNFPGFWDRVKKEN